LIKPVIYCTRARHAQRDGRINQEMGERSGMTSKLTIVEGIDYFGVAQANDPAWSDGDRTLTFGAIRERSNRAAAGFLAEGVEPGRHVAVMLDNQLASPEVIAAIAKAGLVIVPLNTHSTATEVAELLRRTEPAAIVTEAKYVDTMATAATTYSPKLAYTVDSGSGLEAWDALVEKGDADATLPELQEMATFCVSFTGGTTGQPKGVMLNHRSRALTFHYMALDFNLGPGRRSINATPLYHGAGMAYGYGFLNAGTHIQTMRKWDPEHLLRLVKQHQPHQLFLVPSQLSDLRELGVGRMREAGFHHIETSFTTAAPLPTELMSWFVAEFPDIVFADVYGGTEAGVVSVLKTPELARRRGSAGPPWFMTEVKLLDENRNEVARGEQGELFSRSPYLFNGYLDDREQTSTVMTDDGFVTAGDVAVQDDDGFLYIVDRVKDMIISGGVNVYPREVEEHLHQHPSVGDVAVVGLPHERWGEELVAIVVPATGARFDTGELRQFCALSLSSFKVPKRFLVRSSLDRTVTGKLSKDQLRIWARAQDS
jgi:long-chain acyl-CoA synthetase